MNATKAKTDEPAEQADADTLAGDVAAVRAALGRIAERLGGADAAAIDKTKAMADDLAGELRRFEGEIADGVRRNPGTGLVAAGLVGFLFGLLIRR